MASPPVKEETRGAPLTSKYSLELGFSFNINLGDNLKFLKNAVTEQDFDAVVIVDGKEGGGKSTIAHQIAVFLDKDNHFDIEKQEAFTPKRFKEIVTTLPKFKAVVYDEARRALDRRKFGMDDNMSVLDMLAECRQRNLFLIIVMPSFYDMDMVVAVWRSRALIHVWYKWADKLPDGSIPERPLKRGFFRFYNEEGKKTLYTDRFYRQSYSYPHLKNMSFDATFSAYFPADFEKYKKMKTESINAFRDRKNTELCPTCGGIYRRKMKDGKYKCSKGHYWTPTTNKATE